MDKVIIEMAFRALLIIDDNEIVDLEEIVRAEGYTEEEIAKFMYEVGRG